MGHAGRPTVAIELSAEESATLRRWARRHSSSQALALRSRRSMLACAEGMADTAIARDLGCHPVTVSKWRHRFAIADRLRGWAMRRGPERHARSVTR
ncbi:MAG: helix-turn-helix domain-containing protein [Candidatus Nanopelagicales bacterium]